VTLGELIEKLETAPQNRVLALGFRNPHSYRGYYDNLAFEPAENVPVSEMLNIARGCVGATFGGWKGGGYTMDAHTDVWLANLGDCGESIGPLFLGLMLANEASRRLYERGGK